MASIAYLRADADRLHLDPDRIVLAGDSAGAQLAAQSAAMTAARVRVPAAAERGPHGARMDRRIPCRAHGMTVISPSGDSPTGDQPRLRRP